LLYWRFRGALSRQERIIKAVCLVLIYVGAGYCTLEEPGVIKAFGVPLGWTCAALLVLNAYAAELQRKHQRDPLHDAALQALGVLASIQAWRNWTQLPAGAFDAELMETAVWLMTLSAAVELIRRTWAAR
jgi:hypothetical protein